MQTGKLDFKKIGTGVTAIVLGAALLGGTYYLGYTQGTETTKNIVVQGVSNPQLSKNGIDFKPFWEALSVIQSKYVSQQKAADGKAIVYGAIQGMVDSLGDPYTNFLTPDKADEFNQEISGQFSGIGAEIGTNDNKDIIVIAPLKDTPAFKAGMQPGDVIRTIDGKSAEGLTVDEAVNLIRGKRGTQVTLVIARGEKELDLTITRDVIVLPTLDYKRLDESGNENANGDIAYIKLYNFYEKSASQFRQAAIQAAGQHVKGVIVDLRGNPGGYLDAAVEIAGLFVPKGETVVKEEFRNASDTQEYASAGPAMLKNIPLAVMVNRGSASASEILAGALKEKAGAVIMGEKSFGKGTVQELVPLMDDSVIKVTIAHWLTPNGTLIDKNGIMPDISLPESTDTSTDTWLKPAVQEVVRKMK